MTPLLRSIHLQDIQALVRGMKTLDGMRATAVALRLLSSLVPLPTLQKAVLNVTNGFLLGTHTWVIHRACLSLLEEEKTFSFQGELPDQLLRMREAAKWAIVGSAFSMFVASSSGPIARVRDIAQLVGVGTGAALVLLGNKKKKVETESGEVTRYKKLIQDKEKELEDLKKYEEQLSVFLEIADVPKEITIGEDVYTFAPAKELSFSEVKMQFKANLLILRDKIESARNLYQESLATKLPPTLRHNETALAAAFVFVGVLPLLIRSALRFTIFSKLEVLTTTVWAAANLALALSENYSAEIKNAKNTVKNLHHVTQEYASIEKKMIIPVKLPQMQSGKDNFEVRNSKRVSRVSRIRESMKDSVKKLNFIQKISAESSNKKRSKSEAPIQEATQSKVFSITLPTGQQYDYYDCVDDTTFEKEDEKEKLVGNIRKTLNDLINSLHQQAPHAQNILHFHQLKLSQAISCVFAGTLPLIVKNLPKAFASLAKVASAASVGLTLVGFMAKSPDKSSSLASFFPVASA